MMPAVGSNRCGEIGQNVEALKVAGFGDSQQARGSEFAVGAAITKADLAPRHTRAEGAFHAVMGGCNALPLGECKEPVVMLEKRRGQSPDLPVRAVQMPLCQLENPFLNRDGSPQPLPSVDLAAAVFVPQRKEPGNAGPRHHGRIAPPRSTW